MLSDYSLRTLDWRNSGYLFFLFPLLLCAFFSVWFCNLLYFFSRRRNPHLAELVLSSFRPFAALPFIWQPAFPPTISRRVSLFDLIKQITEKDYGANQQHPSNVNLLGI